MAQFPEQISASAVDGSRLYRRLTLRLMPFLFLLYVFAYLDRVNVGYAALGIRRELHFSDTVYGTGAGLFFLSYALFEIPSNLVLLRLGPRRWIGTLMVIWGMLSASMPLVHSPGTFYLLRFLLGAAEAGFFPGILLYLTEWFPRARRARAVAWFMTATAVSGIVGGPISSALLRLDGVAGVSGWKWLFVAEGLPSVVLGIIVLLTLTDRPAEANWLSTEERRWLMQALAQDRQSSALRPTTLRAVVTHSVVWRLSYIYFAISVGLYSLSMWLPVVLKQLSGASDTRVLLLTSLPYLLAVVVMVLVAHHSDESGERRWHLGLSLLPTALGFALSGWLHSPVLAMAALFIAIGGTWAGFGPFWALPSEVLGGEGTATGIAFINSVGALGGFLGPAMMGRISDLTHSFSAALLAVAGLLLAAMAIVVTLPIGNEPRVRRRREDTSGRGRGESRRGEDREVGGV